MTHDQWFKATYSPNISENSLTYRDTKLAYEAGLRAALNVVQANANIVTHDAPQHLRGVVKRLERFITPSQGATREES